MKILHLSHRFRPCLGGIETHVRQLCENLLAKDLEQRVVCLNKCPNSNEKLPAEESFHGIEIKRLGFLDLGFYRIAPGVARNLKNCDAVHVHGLGFFSDFLALTKFWHRKRLVLSTHGAIFHTGQGSFLKRLYFFGWCRLTLKAFDRIVAVSKQDHVLFNKVAPEKKITLIENPIETERFNAVQRKPKENSFLFVGRLSKNKGLLNLLETFALLKESGKKFSLTIAGKGFDLSKEDVQKRAKVLGLSGEVSVVGEVSERELMQLYTENEFFASASEYEGFGISAVEAMAAGLIPVLNRIQAFETFVEEGRTGFLADFGNPEKAAEKLKKAISTPLPKKREISQEAVLFAGKFSWKSSIEKFEAVYSK